MGLKTTKNKNQYTTSEGAQPQFPYSTFYHTYLDHKHLCHLEIIQSTQPLLSNTREAECSIFEVILPLPSEKNTSARIFLTEQHNKVSVFVGKNNIGR